jgi:ComF family protein
MLGLKQAGFVGGLKRLPRLAADIVLPPTCPGCGKAVADGDALCARCWSAVRFIEPPLCPIYGTPFLHDLGEGIVSAEALADPPPFRRARSAAVYGDVARRLVHQLKYYDRPHMAQVMAVTMRRAAHVLIPEIHVIVPVPLYRLRLWQRRFNQAALLAESLSKLTGVPHDPMALERIKPTRRQVGLSAAQRLENVRGAFRVPDHMRHAIAGRAVLLVDDVYTSGATAKAATRALLRGGAEAVDVLTFARVVP